MMPSRVELSLKRRKYKEIVIERNQKKTAIKTLFKGLPEQWDLAWKITVTCRLET